MAPPDQDIRNRLLVVRLPTLPHILLKLIEYCRAERVGMAELAELVSKDTAIAAKIVSVANSSAFHRGGQKAKLEQSLMALGTDMIRTIVISQSVFQTLNQITTASTADLCRFWEHSLTNAVLARDIARKTGYLNIDEAYLCGLLHDVARLAFLAISPGKYAELFPMEDNRDLCKLEQDRLQITHTEAGAWLTGRWKLSQDVSDSILFHHEPVTRLHKTGLLVRVIYLAHTLSCNAYDSEAVREAAKLCQLTPEDLAPMQNAAVQKVVESAAALGIDLNRDDALAEEKPEPQTPATENQLKTEIHQVVYAAETERHFARQTTEHGLLNTIVQSVKILFGIDAAIILTLDSLNQNLIIDPHLEYQQPIAGFTHPLKQGSLLTDAVAMKRPAFIARGSQSIAEEPFLKLLQTDTIIAVPLVADGKCLAVMIGKVLPEKIPDLREHIAFLQVFATQAASALIGVRKKQEDMRNLATNAVDAFRLSSRKIAHEATNPLTVIKNYLHVLNDKLSKQQPVGNEITILNDEIDRVCNIIQKFVDPQPTNGKTTTNINQIIDDISRMLRDSGFMQSAISIEIQRNESAATTDCDGGKIWQVLLNLLKNAIEAMPHGGKITLANQGLVSQNGRLHINLLVKDTGTGVPQHVMENLFAPVSSSKGGRHQGLGLSIVQDLINELNGVISCRSSGNGTAFDILLPVRSASVNPAWSPKAS